MAQVVGAVAVSVVVLAVLVVAISSCGQVGVASVVMDGLLVVA